MYEIFRNLLEEKGYKTSDVAKGTGINQTVFSEWKKGKSAPKIDKLQKIADFFGVTTDFLIGKGGKKYTADKNSLLIALINEFPSASLKVLSTICKSERINRDYTEKFVSSNAEISLNVYLDFENNIKAICVDDIIKILLFYDIDINYITGLLTGALVAENANPKDLNLFDRLLLEDPIRDGLISLLHIDKNSETFTEMIDRILSDVNEKH